MHTLGIYPAMTNPNDNALLRLHEIVRADPECQARLFSLQDADIFIAEIQRLAESNGLILDEDAIRQAMRFAQMRWIERRMP